MAERYILTFSISRILLFERLNWLNQTAWRKALINFEDPRLEINKYTGAGYYVTFHGFKNCQLWALTKERRDLSLTLRKDMSPPSFPHCLLSSNY
jgi:hypothetical protein